MKSFLRKFAAVMIGVMMTVSFAVPVMVYANNDISVAIDDETNDVIANETQDTISIRRNTISAGDRFSFAVLEDGNLWAWGHNNFGQLGDGTTETRRYPVHILDDVVSVFSGTGRAMAIRADGSLWAWGRNNNGQLGDGTRTDRHSPVHIMDDVVYVALATSHTHAITSDGSLWGWGFNGGGQLGDGTRTRRTSPVWIMDDVLYVSAGMHTRVIRSDGHLWSWGHNSLGGLGDGTRNIAETPIIIMENVVSVSDGVGQTTLVRADGSVWAWGSGALGDGIWRMSTHPYPIHIMDNAVSVSTARSTAVIDYYGSLWTWGSANVTLGRMYDDITEMELRNAHATEVFPLSLSPGRVDLDGVVAVSVGDFHMLTLTADGVLWAWGRNWNGEFGIGGTGAITDVEYFPIRIMDGIMLP